MIGIIRSWCNLSFISCDKRICICEAVVDFQVWRISRKTWSTLSCIENQSNFPWFSTQVEELKEAEQQSLKESERLEKEIADVQELKVMFTWPWCWSSLSDLFSFALLSMLTYTCFVKQTKLGTMTADEYFEKHPELKKKFDDEIRNDYWGY